MALINTIRKHSGLLVGIIAAGLILFLLGGDIVRLTSILSGKNQTDVGKIAGQRIAFQAYQAQVEQLRRLLRPSSGTEEGWIRDQAWRQLIIPLIYQKEYNALGMMTSEDELVDMVQGDHIHPELQAAFQDPATKQFDKQQLTDYLQKLAKMPEAQQAQWHRFERGLAALRQREKINQLIAQSTYITSLEAKAQHDAFHTTLHTKCLYIPYHAYPDDAIEVQDKTLRDYLATHKNDYQVEESRKIQYVIFPIIPTKEDEQVFQVELEMLKKSFGQAKDDRTFASINTDGKPSQSYFSFTAQQLPDALAKQESQLKKGLVIGPVQEGNVYRFYKVAAITPQAAKKYEIAIIDKQPVASDQTRDQLFRKADYCASTVKDATQLAAYATQEDLPLHEAMVGKNTVQVGTLTQARELVRWLYNDAVVGKVSPVFELGSTYVVAVMTQRVPAGTAPLEQVYDEVALKVRNELKARAIMAKLQETNSTTLEEKITCYGDSAKLLEVENLCFKDDSLQSAGTARQTVGTAFALQPGEQATVVDDNGVMIVEVVAKNTAVTLEDTTAYQQNLRRLDRIKQPYNVLRALEELAQIKDNRYKFY